MNSVELLDKRNQLKIQAENILSSAEKELRVLNDLETEKFEALKREMEDTDRQIKELNNKLKTSTRSMENFSLLKAINDVANNRQLDERA